VLIKRSVNQTRHMRSLPMHIRSYPAAQCLERLGGARVSHENLQGDTEAVSASTSRHCSAARSFVLCCAICQQKNGDT
jgi:hypothetical protein